jgi:hypothetical protein
MNTVRYILFGAAIGCVCSYLSLWMTTAVLVDAIRGEWLMVIPACWIVGGLCGYLGSKRNRTRDATRGVHVLPERTQDSTHATAA